MAAIHKKNIRISGRDARITARLLRKLTAILSAAIDGCLVAGEMEPREEIDRVRVRLDRADVQNANRLARLLEEESRL